MFQIVVNYLKVCVSAWADEFRWKCGNRSLGSVQNVVEYGLFEITVVSGSFFINYVHIEVSDIKLVKVYVSV